MSSEKHVCKGRSRSNDALPSEGKEWADIAMPSRDAD